MGHRLSLPSQLLIARIGDTRYSYLAMPLRFETSSSGKYDPVIRALPPLPIYSPEHLLTDSFRLYRDTDLEMFYAPFEAINRAAKIAIVGITPGFQQMEIAIRSARAAIVSGRTNSEACVEAKANASFAGTMRLNLIKMLNEIRLHEALGIPDCGRLFDAFQFLLHTTSAMRYPVFVRGENYTGHSPRPLRHSALREMVFNVLASELAEVPDALIVPLGKAVEECLSALISSGLLSQDRCLFGFPHPSGGNGHRKRLFEQNRDMLQVKAASWFAGRWPGHQPKESP